MGVNLYVRKPLPISGMPWRMEASAELRNLLAQGYLPLGDPGTRSVLNQFPTLAARRIEFHLLRNAALVVEAMRPQDWDAVRAIFRGIAREMPPSSSPRLIGKRDHGHLQSMPVGGADYGAEVLGWTALGPVSSRRVYSGVAEFSIYVAERARGRGIGTALLKALIQASEQEGIWTLQSGIFPAPEFGGRNLR